MKSIRIELSQHERANLTDQINNRVVFKHIWLFLYPHPVLLNAEREGQLTVSTRRRRRPDRFGIVLLAPASQP